MLPLAVMQGRRRRAHAVGRSCGSPDGSCSGSRSSSSPRRGSGSAASARTPRGPPTRTRSSPCARRSPTGSTGGLVAILAAVLTVVGVVDLIRRRDKLWFVAGWAVAVLLFVVAAAGPSWRLRALVVGIFYRDPPRLASLLVDRRGADGGVRGDRALASALQRLVLPRLGVQPGTSKPLEDRRSRPARPARRRHPERRDLGSARR